MKAGLALVALLVSTSAFAQSAPAPPGPYVFDFRGTMSGVPSAAAFHPVLPGGTLVPKRGFGLGGGAHVYLFTLGPARVGVGIEGSRSRGTSTTLAGTSTATTTTTTTTTDTSTTTTTAALDPAAAIRVETTVTVIAPQVSFNFGTRDGWSYLSGGYGTAQIHSSASGQLAAPFSGAATFVQDGGRAAAINYGGGARWFIKDHLAVGFDLRFHLIGATAGEPKTRSFVLAAGLSVR